MVTPLPRAQEILSLYPWEQTLKILHNKTKQNKKNQYMIFKKNLLYQWRVAFENNSIFGILESRRRIWHNLNNIQALLIFDFPLSPLKHIGSLPIPLFENVQCCWCGISLFLWQDNSESHCNYTLLPGLHLVWYNLTSKRNVLCQLLRANTCDYMFCQLLHSSTKEWMGLQIIVTIKLNFDKQDHFAFREKSFITNQSSFCM